MQTKDTLRKIFGSIRSFCARGIAWAMGLLGVVAIVGWIYRPIPQMANGSQPTDDVTRSTETAANGPDVMEARPIPDRLLRDFFGRNDIRPSQPDISGPVRRPDSPGPLLKAIIIAGKRRAWIEDYLVCEGQRFRVKADGRMDDELEVVRIETDKVYLKKGTEVMVLAVTDEEGPQKGEVGTPQ